MAKLEASGLNTSRAELNEKMLTLGRKVMTNLDIS